MRPDAQPGCCKEGWTKSCFFVFFVQKLSKLGPLAEQTDTILKRITFTGGAIFVIFQKKIAILLNFNHISHVFEAIL